MATNIFLILNGLSVAFLVYVLFHFWKEGRRSTRDPEHQAAFGHYSSAEVFVVTHPISHNAQGGIAVVPFQGRPKSVRTGRDQNPATVLQMPAKPEARGQRPRAQGATAGVR